MFYGVDKEPNWLLTTEEVAEYLNVSKYTIRNWRTGPRRRGPQYINVGGSVRYAIEDIISYVNKNKR